MEANALFLLACGIVFLYGTILGSFLNVVIYRLPKDLSVIAPPSACPNCQKKIVWWQNIPLLSYLFLLGKCRNCRWPIPFRYPLVEAISGAGAIFLYTKHPFFYFSSNNFELSFQMGWADAFSFFYYLTFTALLIVIYFIDLDWQVIFDFHSVGGAIIGFLGQIYYTFTGNKSAWLDSIIGLIGGAVFFYLIALVSEWVFKKEAMGGGDVKFAALIGAFLGWKLAFVAFFLSFLIGSIWGILLILIKLKQRRDYIPFGPSMALGAYISLFWGNNLTTIYFDLLRRGLWQ